MDVDHIYKTITNLGLATKKIQEIVEQTQDIFPTGTFNIGFIAEYYVKQYLETANPDSIVTYGESNQKGWDIKEVSQHGLSTTYQVKLISDYSSNRRFKLANNDFDYLYVLLCEMDYFPHSVFLLKNNEELFINSSSPTFTAPNPDIPSQEGSTIFTEETNITKTFHEVLSLVPNKINYRRT